MSVLIDTGPLYAFFDDKDQHHRWTSKKFGKIEAALITCEPVLTETVFLMLRSAINPDALFEFIERGDLKVQPIFHTETNQRHIRGIINTYSDLPASFADACLVQMAEITPKARILTVDDHFNIYRDSDGETLSLIIP